MRIHLLSDIHIEARKPPRRLPGQQQKRATYTPSVTEDEVDVVVLAGDIDKGVRGVEWAQATFPNTPVCYVPGNHEFWHGNVQRTLAKMKAAAAGSNVHVLQRDVVVIDGVRFVGTTGWTDFRSTGNVPIAMLDAEAIMRDYKRIRHKDGYLRWRPHDAQVEASINLMWLREQLAQPFDGKTVLVTHHPVCMLSVNTEDERHPHLDASYGNRWEELFGDHLAYALHGHVHHACSYEVYGTRVVANPVGHAFEDTGHNPWLILEV